MKFIKSLFLTAGLIVATSCTLELQENPNAVQPSQSITNLTLNSIQTSFAGYFQGISTNGMLLTRLQNPGSTNYDAFFTAAGFNGTWSTAYSNILVDANLVTEQADAQGMARHAGMARVMAAYVLASLVDQFGDIPYSEAFLGAENLNPALDDDAGIYDIAISMLDQAISDLTTLTVAQGGYLNATAPAPQDLFYANTYNSWVRAANSIKLKLFLNLRLTDPTRATTEINNLIAGNQLISTAAQNFVFRYGSNLADPDSRHPRFVANYQAGGGNYMSNWLMWHMFHGYDRHLLASPSQGDPRIRFYFYRQRNVNSSDPNEIRCVSGSAAPSHYPQSTGTAILYNPTAGIPPGISTDPTSVAYYAPSGLPRTFCYPTNIGYWGRDHANPEGIPPDAFTRTAWGAYPAGGRFDANNPANVNQNVGMRGAGFQPIMMRSFVQFMLAESAIYLGTTGTALTHFQNGMDYSFTDVRNYVVNGTFGVGAAATNEAATINTFYPSATYTADVAAYIASATTSYNAQATNDARMNYVAREYWIAAFGNGIEAYNLYRRTGMPTGMQPALNPSPGKYIRSYWYPANVVSLNANVDQKADMTGKVFWDTNTTNLDF
jgi:hypothetical protein